jgi:antiviral helicase SKI2
VRGAAGFFPFAPGGLEGVEAAAALDEQAIRADAVVSAGVREGPGLLKEESG